MALPEHEIAALKRRVWVEGMPELGRLHVGVARGLMARGLDRELYQPRAVQTDAGAATPQIRRAEKGFGDGDEVGMRLPNRYRVAGEHISAAGKGDELAFRLGGSDQRVEAEQGKRRRLAVGLRVDIAAQRSDPMGRRRDAGGEALS